jgi:hypothetical protein
MLGRQLVALDRHSGEVRWTRQSTRETTTYALGGDTLFGLDCDVPEIGGGKGGNKNGLLFAMNPETGEVAWQKPLEYDAVPSHKVESPRLWLPPVIPDLSYNAKHRLIVLAVNRNDLHVFAADGTPVWSKTDAPKGDIQRTYSPVVTDDYLLLSGYKGCFAFLLDIRTGKEVGPDTGIPRPRTCARVIGNNSLLVYRDAATELYDIPANRMIRFNSVRSGCTTGFIPAGGVLTAPMLGHGCVCNYPMFASLGLYHCPDIEPHRPASVTQSWVNQARPLLGVSGRSAAADPSASRAVQKVAVERFHLINATLEASGAALLFSTKDQNAGYAVQESAKPLPKAVFSFAVKRAVGKSGERRHGNAFFVCGKGKRPEDWLECRLYYGGRSSLMITGGLVKQVEEKVSLGRRDVFDVTVSVDCAARTVTIEAGGSKLTSQITGPLDAITHYGYGGSNSDNEFTDVQVR